MHDKDFPDIQILRPWKLEEQIGLQHTVRNLGIRLLLEVLATRRTEGKRTDGLPKMI